MKIAFVLSRFPYDLTKGDKLRAYHHIKQCAKHFEVILICVSDRKVKPSAIEELKPYCSEIHLIPLNRLTILWNLITGLFHYLPFQVLYFYQKSAQKQIDKIIETRLPKHIFCQLIRSTEYVKKYNIIPSTLDYMDAFSTGIDRRRKKTWPLFKPLFTAEYNRLKRYESDIFKFFKHKTIISEQDRNLIQHPKNHQIKVLKNGVDLEFFKPQESAKISYDICFVGNMSYPPNIQAARILALEVLPLVQKKLPHINLLIAGANPVNSIQKLQSAQIKVAGRIPDIRRAYAQSKIFVAPMMIGTGLQNKILEAMAMGIPCITTNLANQAIGATDRSELLIAETSESTATAVINLLSNTEMYNALRTDALKFVRNFYSWEANSKILVDLFIDSKNGTSVDNIE
mgnify:CR=1 FL=1